MNAKELGNPGTWKRISSEECVMAFFAAIAMDIESGKSDNHLKKWYGHMLTVPATFTKTSKDVLWLAEQRRENNNTNLTLACHCNSNGLCPPALDQQRATWSSRVSFGMPCVFRFRFTASFFNLKIFRPWTSAR